MQIFIDGHVHLYEHYDLNVLFETALKNFARNGATENAIKILLLTELASCDFYTQLGEKMPSGFNIKKTAESTSVIVTKTGTNEDLIIIAGRQLVSSDNLEILALGTEYNIENYCLDTESLIYQVNANGGVAVLNWAPGKWFSKRGIIVNKMIFRFNPETLLIGDSTMRPTLWPTPRLMKKALKFNFKVIAGSDPLPLKNEEKYVASYGFLLQADIDTRKASESLKNLLKDQNIPVKRWGHRSGSFTFFRRQLSIMLRK
ncbi:hypothetical protein JW935_16895 [candidate division KSB1 bacterium]|nr:hypothetical protein [candidate division KSB1 bacterium]